MNSAISFKTTATVFKLVSSRQHHRRNFSARRIFASLLDRFTTNQPLKPEPTKIKKMSTINELEQEKQRLEERVHELVNTLESKKQPNEIRLKPEQVIKSKAEQEAAAALEKLEINERSQTAGNQPAPVASTVDKKKSEPKSGKQKGGAAPAKEPEKPVNVSRLDLRIGKILEVSRHPDADALYVEKIDCGDSTGPRTVISGLVKHVPIEEMQNRLVVVLCNLKPAKMRGILSEAMVMCASTPDKVELIQPPESAKPGDRLVFDNYPGEPDSQLNPKKKIWEQVSPDLKTNQEGDAMYKECPFKISGIDGAFKSNLPGVNIR